MRKLILGLTLVGVIAIPATSASARANPARKAARLACIQERAAIGGEAFRAKYGAHEAMQACITQHGGGSPPPPKPHPRHHGDGGDHGHKHNQGDHSQGNNNQGGD